MLISLIMDIMKLKKFMLAIYTINKIKLCVLKKPQNIKIFLYHFQMHRHFKYSVYMWIAKNVFLGIANTSSVSIVIEKSSSVGILKLSNVYAFFRFFIMTDSILG
ncbi:hypothetical protein EDEG_01401 [Edhazardia aedis USNM 41457]|uniref:Uncharacterized protein n=1 Tax=Edhazardia aedis (strain USNM 41457) TaxID=1003232 RepID=J9DP58_EDHAE|nr:hypothetical protein EDEG_01401 [Edhazardia aedis USNM 41457]|eukprot:EJW04335.1 hypothetical protein EDEG_01401 [Edhazardia aedis USNM 41457]